MTQGCFRAKVKVAASFTRQRERGGMKKVVILALFMTGFFLFCPSTARAETPESLIVSNVKRMLRDLGLESYIRILGVSKAGTEVIAVPVTGVDFYQLLQFRPDFGPDVSHSGFSHPNCLKSVRLMSNPSLQVTFYNDHMEIDIDRFAPRWDRPFSIIEHFCAEVWWHWALRHVGSKRAHTNQLNLVKVIEKWERRRAKKAFQLLKN